jgi:hypothetical protein
VLTDFIYGANIGVVRGGSSLRLTLKVAQRLSIWRERVRKELQGNEAMELGILSFINNTHTAAELFENAVVRDGLANHGQRLAQS